jgi:hypothetical protein
VPHAADLEDGAVKLMLSKLVFECPEYFQSAGGTAAGGGTNHDDGLSLLKPPPSGFGLFLYSLEI